MILECFSYILIYFWNASRLHVAPSEVSHLETGRFLESCKRHSWLQFGNQSCIMLWSSWRVKKAYSGTWCWNVPLSRLHAGKILLFVDCLPGCVFVARCCAKHSKGALACQRQYLSYTKGKMLQSVIVVSYYMSPSYHAYHICHNCM